MILVNLQAKELMIKLMECIDK